MRIILKTILGKLAKWAINKHEMEIIVVTGFIGVDLVKEGIYTVLDEKYVVRRNTKRVWWDLSIPLNVLGFDDIRRNPFEWVILIIKSIFILLFSSKNPSILVLSAESEDMETAKYWSSVVKPDFLVIVHNKKSSVVTKTLIKETSNKGIIIYDQSDFEKGFKDSFMYGESKGAKVIYKETKTSVVITYKEHKITIPKYYLPPFAKNIIAAIVSVAISKGMQFEDIFNGLLKFDMRNSILKKLSEKLGDEKKSGK